MKKREKIMEYVFLLAAVISIVAVALICIFLFTNGIPAMKKIGFAEFLTGTKWKPGNNKFGIFPMILGSIYVTGGALIIGVPVGFVNVIESKELVIANCRRPPFVPARGRGPGRAGLPPAGGQNAVSQRRHRAVSRTRPPQPPSRRDEGHEV